MRSPESLELTDLLRWALASGGFATSGWRVSLLQGDGSDRRFYRLEGRSGRLIALVSPRRPGAAVDENDSYAAIGGLLRRTGLPVPRFHVAAPEAGCFLMDDLGNLHLQSFAARLGSPARLEQAYRAVIRMLLRLHRRVPARFSSEFCFDGAVYNAPFVFNRELEYFRTAFVNGYLGGALNAADFQPDFDRIADQAGRHRSGQVLHRDFQSRNLMVNRGHLGLLDFQGMRWGPATYDLASLLLDPYMALPNPLQDRLVDYYWRGASAFLQCDHQTFIRDYEMVRLCRHLQVLGAFAFLGQVKGKSFFLDFIPTAWRRLTAWLDRPFAASLPRLRQWTRENEKRMSKIEY